MVGPSSPRFYSNWGRKWRFDGFLRWNQRPSLSWFSLGPGDLKNGDHHLVNGVNNLVQLDLLHLHPSSFELGFLSEFTEDHVVLRPLAPRSCVPYNLFGTCLFLQNIPVLEKG